MFNRQFRSSIAKLATQVSRLCIALILVCGLFLSIPANAQADLTGDSTALFLVADVVEAEAEVEPTATVDKAAAKLEAKKAKAAAKLEAKKVKEAAEAEAEAAKTAEKAAKKAAKLEAKQAKEAAKLEAKKAKEAEKAALEEAINEELTTTEATEEVAP
jgi:hypothetical protein